MYFAQINIDGVVKCGQLPRSISVYKSPDKPTVIGEARYRGRDGSGVAFWVLTVHGNALPGLWVIINREFRPAQGNSRRLEAEASDDL